jgi:hypothetical protein
MNETSKPAKIVRAHCNGCLGEKNHQLLQTEETVFSESVNDGQYEIQCGTNYEMLKCMGCGSVALRATSWFSEEPMESRVRYYPPAISRRMPYWVSDIETKGDNTFIEDILREVYIALQNDSRRLATMGIRALLEHVMIDKIGDKGNFIANLNEFQKQGYVAPKQREILDVVLEVGHAAMHRSYNPSEDDLKSAIDIAENLIQTIYVHKKKAHKMKSTIPKRKRAKSTTPSSKT